MDPLTASILAAVTAGLTAGVAGGATAVSQSVMVDAYNALKSKLAEKFGRGSDLDQAVAALEQNPESEGRQLVVREQIEAVRAYEDPELQGLAKQLLQALQDSPDARAVIGKYQIDARWAQIGVVGDGTNVEGGIHFGG